MDCCKCVNTFIACQLKGQNLKNVDIVLVLNLRIGSFLWLKSFMMDNFAFLFHNNITIIGSHTVSKSLKIRDAVQFVLAISCGQVCKKYWCNCNQVLEANVTHVIASTDESGVWIKACMKTTRPVNEEPYGVGLDSHGCSDGPKTGRFRALDNATKLFDGFSFYFVGDFVSGYMEDLQILIVAAGGTVMRGKEEEIVQQSNCEQAVQTRMFVVYSLDATRGSKLGEEGSIIWQRVSEAQALATKIGGQFIGHTWLLESIAAYKLQPIVS
ncbi:BRCA1-associated RING domain protein 1-like [Durio zibethinus]|uniref:BRCA1-associated RING domain protein 1-like n=1 Tax=Durio zibethinus TaxID=66656 RepID=A0A6P6AXM3_DURZI|nr:BRCA1-associated RING domain protein 1-like [Durio zibethinus]